MDSPCNTKNEAVDSSASAVSLAKHKELTAATAVAVVTPTSKPYQKNPRRKNNHPSSPVVVGYHNSPKSNPTTNYNGNNHHYPKNKKQQPQQQQHNYNKSPTKNQKRPRSGSWGSSNSSGDRHAHKNNNHNNNHHHPPNNQNHNTNKKEKSTHQCASKNNNTHHVAPPPTPLTREEKNQYLAMDCEMVGVGETGHTSILARVTVINWYNDVVLDEYILPTQEVTDYRTFVSGITPEQLLLENGAIPMEACREKIRNLLLPSEETNDDVPTKKIVIGHALKNDLHVLDIPSTLLPWYQIRDTAKYEPFMKTRFEDGILWPRKLKDLVSEKLTKHNKEEYQDFQKEGHAHSPFEDAKAALDLYKLVRTKWEKVMDYKIKKTNEITKKLPQPQPVVVKDPPYHPLLESQQQQQPQQQQPQPCSNQEERPQEPQQHAVAA